MGEGIDHNTHHSATHLKCLFNIINCFFIREEPACAIQSHKQIIYVDIANSNTAVPFSEAEFIPCRACCNSGNQVAFCPCTQNNLSQLRSFRWHPWEIRAACYDFFNDFCDGTRTKRSLAWNAGPCFTSRVLGLKRPLCLASSGMVPQITKETHVCTWLARAQAWEPCDRFNKNAALYVSKAYGRMTSPWSSTEHVRKRVLNSIFL